jgi:hypothetical protein
LEVLRVTPGAASAPTVEKVPDLEPLLKHAISETLRDDGWALLSAVGSFIGKINASFDPRNYGFPKLGELVRSQPSIETMKTAAPH